MQLNNNVTWGCLYSIWQAVYSYLERLLSRVICGNLVITNVNLVQNVVQTWQFVLMIEYNQPTQNNCNGGNRVHLLRDYSVWSSHVHKTPLQMWECSLFTSLLFCSTIFSCSLRLKERIYLVSIHCVSLLDLLATINLYYIEWKGAKKQNTPMETTLCYSRNITMVTYLRCSALQQTS